MMLPSSAPPRFSASHQSLRWLRRLGALFVFTALLAGGCAQTHSLLQSQSLSLIPNRTRVLLLPTDIELYEVTAAGLLEPKAEWTHLASDNVQDALEKELKARGDVLVVYREPSDKRVVRLHQQLFKLYSAVGNVIVRHKILAEQSGATAALPTKKGKFDWSLGSATNSMRQGDADYGLFVYIRDSYTSAGRVAMMVAAALLRVALPGGSLLAFASLVDLKTGDIVWFNLLAVPTGDLRTAEAARETMKGLLEDLPL